MTASNDEGIPEEVRYELEAAEKEALKKLFDEALHVLAKVQKRLGYGNIYSTIQPNGDVAITVIKSASSDKAGSASSDRYATVRLIDGKFVKQN